MASHWSSGSWPSPVQRGCETALTRLFFRLYQLTAIPVGLSIDGSANALKGLDILQGAPYEPLYLSRETMYHYFMAVFFRLFGANLMALRLTSVFFGMLGLIAFHAMARELFDSRLALVATFILATSAYHITYSRTGWRAIQIPVFQFLALGCVLRAARSDQPKRWSNVGWWALGGTMLGLGLNTYEPFRFVVIALGLYVASLLPRRGFLAGWPLPPARSSSLAPWDGRLSRTGLHLMPAPALSSSVSACASRRAGSRCGTMFATRY